MKNKLILLLSILFILPLISATNFGTTINYPLDNSSQGINSYIIFSATGTSSSGALINMSLLTNESGSMAIVSTLTGLFGSSYTANWSRAINKSGTIIWEVQTCRASGCWYNLDPNSNFYGYNYTFNLTNIMNSSFAQGISIENLTFADANLSSCFQESANTSNQPTSYFTNNGTLFSSDGNCGLNYGGSYAYYATATYGDPGIIFDGNWSDYMGGCNQWGGTGNINITYIKPANAVGATWIVANRNTTFSLAVPQSCLNADYNNVLFNLYFANQNGIYLGGHLEYSCWNGTAFQNLTYYDGGTSCNNYYISTIEEAINWTINNNAIVRYLQIPHPYSFNNPAITNAFMNLTGFNTPTVNATNLTAYYKLDEASGAVIDSIDSNNGVNHGATPNVAGIINTAYYFNGSNKNNITFSSVSNKLNSNFSISVWVKENASSYMIWYINGTPDSTMLVNTGGTIFFYINGNNYVQTNVNLEDNNWHNLVVTYNIVTHGMKIYADGVSNPGFSGYTGGLQATANSYFTLGANPHDLNQWFNGTMDEVGVWNRTLTGAEVTNLYNNGNGEPLTANSLTNVSVSAGGVNVFSQSGVFSTNNQTSNFANALNSYNLVCTPIAGYCYVPFLFFADTSGTLQYSNLIFNDFGLIEQSQNYSSTIIGGDMDNFSINLLLGNASNVNASLIYNGTNMGNDLQGTFGNQFIASKGFISPVVTTPTSASFYWLITWSNATGSFSFNSNTYTQTITTVNVTAPCTSGYPFINISNYDEETLLPAVGTTVQYTLTLLNNGIQVAGANGTLIGQNLSICTGQNLSQENIQYNLQLRYFGTNYMYRVYNIQNGQISQTPFTIALYFISNATGTEFQINYVDFNYIPHPGALVQVERQYLANNTYNTVEIPLIGNNDLSQAAFNANNIAYRIVIVENGKIIDSFDKVYPVCQNVVLGQCTIYLRGAQNVQSQTNGDFNYIITDINNALVLTYTIPSGTPTAVVEFLTNQNSAFMNNISTCDNIISDSSSGTITCTYNNTVGNSIIDIEIKTTNGVDLFASITESAIPNASFLGNNYFIAFILVLTLALIFISSGPIMLVISGIGVAYLGVIFLIKGVGIFAVTSSLGWLIVVIVITIYKISSKEERYI